MVAVAMVVSDQSSELGDRPHLVMTGRTLTWCGVMAEHPGWSVGLEDGCPSGTGSVEG